MYSDGRLETLINELLFSSLNERIDVIDNSVNVIQTTLDTNLPSIYGQIYDTFINVKYGYKNEKLGINLEPLKGDGTNELTNIQKYFDLAKTLGKVKLYFPTSVYGIDNGYIRLYKNTYVQMDSDTTIKRLGAYNKMFINGEKGNSTYAYGYNGEGNITFVGGILDLNAPLSGISSTMTLSAFDLAHAKNIKLVDVTITNGQIGHYIQVASCKDVYFINCKFLKQTNNTTGNYELLQIETSSEKAFPTFGGYDDTISENINIIGCEFDGVIRGLGTHSKSGTQRCKNITIQNNIFKNSSDTMLYCVGYEDVKIENNTFSDIGAFNINLNDCVDIKIKGNTTNRVEKGFIFATSVNGLIVNSNNMTDIALNNSASYSLIRLTTCTSVNIDNNVTLDSTPSYEYFVYTSNSCVSVIVGNNNIINGLTNLYGGDGVNIHGGNVILFEGDLSEITTSATLSDSVKNYKALIVVGNDNSSATATVSTMYIPKEMLVVSTSTSRYRMVLDSIEGQYDKIDFSFPTDNSVRLDSRGVSVTTRIRKVIGIR